MLARKSAEKEALQQEWPKMQSGTHTVQGMGVHLARLSALKAGLKLEKLGMKRRGRSCTNIVRQMFGLKGAVGHDELIARLEQEIKELQS
jgi:hypothetical protein